MRLVLLPLLLELALTGCGSPRGDAVADRRTLVVAFGADEFPLTTNRERLGRYPLNAGICEPLVKLTRDFMVAPALAVRWERHEPGAVRFILQRGVTFSNGAPLDAHAVALTLARVARSRIDFSFLADSSVSVVDDTTLDVRPARMNRRLVDQLVHQVYDILAPGSDPARQPVCTGPFRLVDYVAHSHLTVVRNERYRGERARLDTLVFRQVGGRVVLFLVLRNDETVLGPVGILAYRERPGGE